MQGIRRLAIWSQGSQTAMPHHIDQTGQRQIRIDKTAKLVQTEIGRLMSIDLAPQVMRKPGVGLSVVRQNSLAQVSLDNFVERYDLTTFKMALMYGLVAYGTMGVGAFELAEDRGGVFGATLMTVPPWELRPLPGDVTGIDQVSGVEWSRWVPLNWLKENYGQILTFPKSSRREDMRVLEAPLGTKIQSGYSPNPASLTMPSSPWGDSRRGSVATGRGLPDEPHADHVEMREFWTYGDDYSCLRWIIMLGDCLVLDVDYTNEKSRASIGLTGNELPVAPLHVARYLSVGSFYGRGLAEREIDLNRELELVVGEQIQDMREVNRLRALKVPASSGINHRNLDMHLRNKLLVYQPDYAQPNLQPEILQPPTLGEIPGKTAAMLAGIMDDLAAQGPMFGGGVPGRMDTAGGVAIVAEQQQVPLLGTAESIASAMTGVWKSALSILRRRITEDTDLTVTRLDESVIGLHFDRQTGSVRLTEGVAIPDVRQIGLTIRHKLPHNRDITKAQLDDLLAKGLISKVQYRIAAIREGLDLPFVNRAEYENYTTAWSEIIIMFGDGQTPGQTITNPDAENHVIHHSVLLEFMATALFRLASPAVREVFLTHRHYHESNMGVFSDAIMGGDQFGNVGPPNPMAAQLGGMGPPMPGQTGFEESAMPIMPGGYPG